MDPILAEKAFKFIDNRWIFRTGLGQYSAARRVAQRCTGFVPDDEDEQVDDEPRSCYNCQYRRWLVDSFECLLLKKQHY